MANFSFNESMNSIFDKLENFLKTKTVVGEPMNIGETTIVPFISLSFGLGAGGGTGNDGKGNNGDGGGGGTGARISPTAVLILQGNKVELLPIKKNGGLDKLLDMVPGIVEKINEKKEENAVNEKIDE
ncbi:putative spore protein YtfJ [Ruminiclostridium sufflavum DSM 19573]|uniref:Putative spore protein YtfJ n=1 Tax=Ruminiclostridium sufflavum DSM 19573 TaxID=1121337 RepID=A0A318XYY7_9FIRM|nr:spore germination protein GerW family protein [Ruminiclostridium sufflavum]PYG88140.1 putative spore protein YtfJ [Ruminiclostridium sufflavum DSM 19573]